MKWNPFILGGEVFDLSHLDSFEFEFVRPEKADRREERNIIQVHFSDHCFTKPFEGHGSYSSDYEFPSSRAHEIRLFNPERHEFSKRLPEIIKSIGNRSCFFTGRARNLLLIDKDPYKADARPYWVFFWLSKEAKADRSLALNVNSAYLPEHASDPKAKKRPLSFAALVDKVVKGKPIG